MKQREAEKVRGKAVIDIIEIVSVADMIGW